MEASEDPMLYHYTGARGLLGIERSQKLWLTDYRFLNDAEEIRFGLSKAVEVAEELVSVGQVVSEKYLIDFIMGAHTRGRRASLSRLFARVGIYLANGAHMGRLAATRWVFVATYSPRYSTGRKARS
jgi:hypothetical protein